jgi:SNF2 family DNA or RNA helicase
MKNGRPSNLLPLLSIIRHPIASNETQFLKRYCGAKWKALGNKKIWDESGAENLKELADLIGDRLLRRMKTEVLDLPPKVRILQDIQFDPIIEKACLTEINEVMADFWERVKTNQVSEDAAAMVQLGVIRRISSKYKSEHIFKMIEELTEQGQQVVIFTEFVETVNMISDFLTISFVPHVTLTGATKDRQAVVDNFQSGKAKVFVGTSKAGGVGITLTKASNVILIDRPWTPGDTEQAEDRCYRIGQKESVFCYWIQWGEIDKGIDDLLQNKQANISIVLKGKTASIKASNLNDFARQVVQAYRF